MAALHQKCKLNKLCVSAPCCRWRNYELRRQGMQWFGNEFPSEYCCVGCFVPSVEVLRVRSNHGPNKVFGRLYPTLGAGKPHGWATSVRKSIAQTATLPELRMCRLSKEGSFVSRSTT
eukprot:5808840-Amphidinium_carterae.1